MRRKIIGITVGTTMNPQRIAEQLENQIPPAGGGVSDVQLNGATIVQDGVATIPVITEAKGGYGIVRVGNLSNGCMGVRNNNGAIMLCYPTANSTGIKNRRSQGSQYSGTIDASNFDLAVKYAMTDGIGASWTEAEKEAARERMGLEAIIAELTARIEALEGGSEPDEPGDQTALAGAYIADGTFSNRRYTWDEMIENAESGDEPNFYVGDDYTDLYAESYDVVVPDTVTDCGYFYCKNIVLPKTTTHVGGTDCSMGKVYVKATTPPALEEWAFFEITDVIIREDDGNGGYYENQGGSGGTLGGIVVPIGCGNIYRNWTNWSLYADYIEEGEMPI